MLKKLDERKIGHDSVEEKDNRGLYPYSNLRNESYQIVKDGVEMMGSEALNKEELLTLFKNESYNAIKWYKEIMPNLSFECDFFIQEEHLKIVIDPRWCGLRRSLKMCVSVSFFSINRAKEYNDMNNFCFIIFKEVWNRINKE